MIYSNFRGISKERKDGDTFLFAEVDIERPSSWFRRKKTTEKICSMNNGAWFFMDGGRFCRQFRSSLSPIDPLEREWLAKEAIKGMK